MKGTWFYSRRLHTRGIRGVPIRIVISTLRHTKKLIKDSDPISTNFQPHSPITVSLRILRFLFTLNGWAELITANLPLITAGQSH
ncbi:hypothetical protein HZ326_22232 [Fusarium oxysporum f. sp. albedinis]|nr:hypothetical protein HZ326_22232 [Fusarium oxysporum f. sp. albedinis]